MKADEAFGVDSLFTPPHAHTHTHTKQVISQKFQKKAIRKNNLKSAKIQKIPGFGQKKSKYKGKGTTPHWMK